MNTGSGLRSKSVFYSSLEYLVTVPIQEDPNFYPNEKLFPDWEHRKRRRRRPNGPWTARRARRTFHAAHDDAQGRRSATSSAHAIPALRAAPTRHASAAAAFPHAGRAADVPSGISRAARRFSRPAAATRTPTWTSWALPAASAAARDVQRTRRGSRAAASPSSGRSDASAFSAPPRR